MENPDNNKYKIISIALIIAILATIAFAIVPNFLAKSPEQIIRKVDFSNSIWIEQYMEEKVGLFGKDFYIGTAFSYNIRSNKMIATYASQNSIEDARDHYLALPEAKLSGRNDETSLNINAKVGGQNLKVYNYYSSISRVFELELTLDEISADQVISQLGTAFPIDVVAQIDGIEELISGKIFGGYVRYEYDQFDGYAHPDKPIFSRAYFYDGSKEDFDRIIAALNEIFPENRYDDAQRAQYYRIDGRIISLSYLVTSEEETIVTISVQQEP